MSESVDFKLQSPVKCTQSARR